jgi:hypothetical protein
MGSLDDVVGKMKDAVGGGEHSALANEVLGLLSGGSEGGGLQGVIRSFKEKGLGDIMSSWIGTGQNLPISGDQLPWIFRRALLANVRHKGNELGARPNSLLELRWCRRRDLNPHGFPHHPLKQAHTLQRPKCGYHIDGLQIGQLAKFISFY